MALAMAAQFFQRLNFFSQQAKRNDSASCVKFAARSERGHVSLVGAGPGDPDLLTIKALKAIEQADVVLFDWLVSDEIMALIPAQVERVFVGKKCGRHSMTQGSIVDLMLEFAQQGKRVVRLKGGDPVVFGRLGEETTALANHQIPFTIVPGITAASGAAAYSGISLTDRSCAQSVRFITAHLKNEQDEPNWQQLCERRDETLVFYMGLNRLSRICYRLHQHGLPNDWPVAVIDKATTREQKICTGNLHTIAEKVLQADFEGPSLIIVGQVVQQHEIMKDMLQPMAEKLTA